MKKQIGLVLVLGLTLSLSGCSQAPITSTELSDTSVQQRTDHLLGKAPVTQKVTESSNRPVKQKPRDSAEVTSISAQERIAQLAVKTPVTQRATETPNSSVKQEPQESTESP